MKEFEFTQELTKEDMIKYNFFALQFNKGLTFNMRFIGFLCLITGIYMWSVNVENYLYAIIVLVLGLFCIFAIVPIYKVITKNKIMKRKNELPTMKVIVGEKGIIYDFLDKEKKDTDLKEEQVLEWEMINKAILEDGSLYILCSNTYIIVIKQSACENFEEMEKLFIEKLGLNERYFNQKNHFFLNKKS